MTDPVETMNMLCDFYEEYLVTDIEEDKTPHQNQNKI